ncbi:MAG: hypothetical protein ACP5G8_02755 [Athalassotoga sp.]
MCHVYFTLGNLSWDVFYIIKIFENPEDKTIKFISDKFHEFNGLSCDKNKSEKIAKIKDIVDSIYQNYHEELEESIRNFEGCWKEVEPQFIRTLSNVFGLEKSDLKRNFVCFVGINPICPRNIKYGTFSVPFYIKCSTLKKVVAHELTHFLYFMKISQIEHQNINTKNFDKSSFEWLMSEIIAPIVLNDVRIHEIIGKTPIYSYVCSKDMSEQIYNLYNNIRKNKWDFERFYLLAKELVLKRESKEVIK